MDKVGNESLIFIGLGEPLESGARGIFNTMIKSMENIFGSNNKFNNERGFIVGDRWYIHKYRTY